MKLATGIAASAVAALTFFGAGPSPDSPGGFAFTASAAAYGQGSSRVSLGYFHQQLSPYGRWVRHPRYGAVFQPYVKRGWRPYTIGHWVNTIDYGWMWASDEPFGWATYHYGSWGRDRDFGWFWVPGYVWGPAWVTWADRGDYVGWAPIPPDYLWGDAFALFVTAAIVVAIADDDDWCFTRTRDLGHRRLDRHVRPSRENGRYVRHRYHNDRAVQADGSTITNIAVVNDRVINQGFALDAVNAVAESPVETVTIAETSAPPSTDTGGAVGGAGIVEIYRPVEVSVSTDPAALEALADQTIAAAGVDPAGVPTSPAEANAQRRIEKAQEWAEPPPPPVEPVPEPQPQPRPEMQPVEAAPAAEPAYETVPEPVSAPLPEPAYEAVPAPMPEPVYEAPPAPEPVMEAPPPPAPEPEPVYEAPPAPEPAPVEAYAAPEPEPMPEPVYEPPPAPEPPPIVEPAPPPAPEPPPNLGSNPQEN